MTRLLQLATTLLIAPLLADSARSDEPVPEDEQLQARGARIGRVAIQVDPVFEQTQPLAAPYRLANSLHIPTRERTIEQQLLFGSGQLYDRRLLDESERLLRDQRYLNDASITPVRYNEDGTVDMVVRVHDVWTLNPGLSFGRSGGENRSSAQLEDANFLGLGKRLSLERSSNVDRTAWELGYQDPNVFGSRWKLGLGLSSSSDGSERAFALARPFYSLDCPWGVNIEAADTTSAVSRYSLGEVVQRFDMQERQFDFGGGVSTGLHEGWVTRYLAGVRYDSRTFLPRPQDPGAILPDDRTFAYPWVGIEVIEDEYITARNLDQIGRTEDLYLGRRARLEVGFASPAFGSTRPAVMLDAALQAGADLGQERYLIHELALQGRVAEGGFENLVLELDSRYYQRHSPKRVFFAELETTLTSNLDAEEQLLLGGDSGLRGYPLRYQAGSASTLITLEERFYTNWQPLKLVNVGAAVFVDAGRTWGQDAFAAKPAGWLADVGFGLRLGSARSGLGNVLHIDLAFPLNRSASDIDGVQLLIETEQSF
jgi:Omp85 superfamily domain